MVTTIGEILPEAARRFGNKVSVVVEGEEFSFADMDAMSNKVANGLVSIGVLPGDRVTLYGPNSWQWVVGYYAIARCRCGGQSDQRDADHRRGPLCGQGLRGARPWWTSSDKGVAVAGPRRCRGSSRTSSCGARTWGRVAPPCRRGSTRVTMSSCCGLGTRQISERSATPPGRPVTPRARCRAIRSVVAAERRRRCSWARADRPTGSPTRYRWPMSTGSLCAQRIHAGRFHSGHGAALRRSHRAVHDHPAPGDP